MNEKNIVREGYDKVSQAYRSEAFDYDNSGYKTYLSWLQPLLAPGSKVLDLGCGCGVPVSRELAKRHSVLGVDLSPVQVERARVLVPNSEFVCADMTEIQLPEAAFDVITSFYAVIHVPLAQQPALFDQFARWLKPGGYVLLSAGHTQWTGTEENWCDVQGATMYWSHADAQTYRNWLQQRGFCILKEAFHPEGEGGHTILLAQSRPHT